MVVADNPGWTEDEVGKPLQGKSGKLFADMIERVGIKRKDLYITHATKCHAPDNRPPTAAEIKACKPYLDAEIERVNPEVIITLGAVPLKAMLRKSKITELHGQVLDYGDRKLIPTFNPGMALRDPAKIEPLRKDIARIGFHLRGQIPDEGSIHWAVIRTLDQWNAFIEELEESPELAVDIETTGLDRHAEGSAINSIQVSLSNGRNYALPLAVRDSPWKPKQQARFVETLVEQSEGKVVVGQNFKFDNLWVWEKFGVRFHLGFDTMLAHHILDENGSHGLKELATEYCNAPSYDIDLKTKLGLGDLQKFYKYGCLDTYYTLKLYRVFRAMLLKDPSLRRLFYKLVMPIARMFEEVEFEGLFINTNKLEKTDRTLSQRRIDILDELEELGAGGVNWNSPQQVADVLFKRLKLPVLDKTAAGKPSTSESVLLRLRDQHPVAEKIVEFRGIEKNLSTYVHGWKKLMHGDRLYLSTKIHGTVTGRFSSRLHQVPRDPMIRSHIDAPPGWVHVCADYSQIELRLAAMLSGDARMLQIFQTGGDIHKETAAFLLGKAPDQLTKEERKLAKAINFGLVYGMGAPKLVIYARDNYGVDMPLGDAQRFRKRFFELYAGLLPWHERQRRAVRAFGQVTSLSGRVRRLPGINSSEQGIRAEAERLGINSPVQGFGSGDLKAMAMLEVHREFGVDGRDWVRVKGEVHDSVLMWINESVLDVAIPEIKEVMEAPSLLDDFRINMRVPLAVDFEVGPWGLGKEWK